MKIALRPSTEPGRRAVLILLNETGLTDLGLIGATGPDDPRIRQIEDADGFDVVATDASDPGPDAEMAQRAGASFVASTYDVSLEAVDRSVVTGASLRSGLAPALAFHEVARTAEPLEQVLAWTEPGRPLRRGEAVPFPDPVGAVWGREISTKEAWPIPTRLLAAPVDGEWAGASARITGLLDDGIVQRVVGVADLAAHLEAIALAAAAAAVALGHYPGEAVRPTAAADPYLSKALEMGLAVATHAVEEERSKRRR